MPSVRAADHAGGDTGDDAGSVKLLGKSKGAVGGDHGEHDLDDRFVDPLGDLGGDPTHHAARDHANADDLHEVHRHTADGADRTHRVGHDNRVEHHRGTVVEEALALDQYAQPLRYVQALEIG